MQNEIGFNKYETRGAYHWEQISRSIRRHNAYVSARYDAVLSALADVGGQRLIDVGGGDGVLSYLLARRGAHTVTADTAQGALRIAQEESARRGFGGALVRASAYALPFASGSFDAAVCSDVVEHVQAPDRLLSEAARLLRSGGQFVLTTPLRVTEDPSDPMHVREFFAGEVQDMMSLDFNEVTVTAFAPLSLLELFRLPLRWLRGRAPFRYLFNACVIYLKRNPFAARIPFRYFSMIIATGRKG